VWFASSLTRASLSTDQKLEHGLERGQTKNLESITKWRKVLMYKPKKKNKNKKETHGYLTESTNPGQLFPHYLHVRIEEISTLLAGST